MKFTKPKKKSTCRNCDDLAELWTTYEARPITPAVRKAFVLLMRFFVDQPQRNSTEAKQYEVAWKQLQSDAARLDELINRLMFVPADDFDWELYLLTPRPKAQVPPCKRLGRVRKQTAK
jgi:hypothetical protein